MQISRRAVNFQLYAPANSAEFSADSNENSSSSWWEKYCILKWQRSPRGKNIEIYKKPRVNKAFHFTFVLRLVFVIGILQYTTIALRNATFIFFFFYSVNFFGGLFHFTYSIPYFLLGLGLVGLRTTPLFKVNIPLKSTPPQDSN